MSEISESTAMLPCSGNWDSILKNLYVDLFNLIVESRIPGANERGYGNGYHCPPLLGTNVHLCDLMKPECRKHQTMIHHLLRAVTDHVFEIEVLMLPDCCSDSKLSERIKNKEYVLLERWSMTFLQSDKTQSTIEVLELLRAVRSFLHFSQISAWLSSTKGKSPANVYYWVKPTADVSSTEFENNPVVHFFPVCKFNDDLCGIVKVDYPTRTQFIPIIPCSKHPPLQPLRLKLTEDSDINQVIPLNQHIVKHLQKNCDNQQSIISVKHCTTITDPLKTNSTIVLQSVTQNVSDINKTNRILRHSNNGVVVKSASGIIPKSSCAAQINNKNETSTKSETTFLSNYQTYSKSSSQENLYSNKSSLTSLSSRIKSKIIFKRFFLPPFCKSNCVSVENSNQRICNQSMSICSNLLQNKSSSEMCNESSNLPITVTETSQTSLNACLDSKEHFEFQKNSFKKSMKRKRSQGREELQSTPREKRMHLHEDEKLSLNDDPLSSYQKSTLNEASKVYCQFRGSKSKDAKLIKCVQIENFRNYYETKQESCYQNAFNSSSFPTSCISTEVKSMEEGMAVSVENDSNLNLKYHLNDTNNASNKKFRNNFVKLKLNDSSGQNGCVNPIPNKNCITYCDNINPAKSIDCKLSKYSNSNLTLNMLRPLNSFSSSKEVKLNFCRNCSYKNNETIWNLKSAFRNKKSKNTKKISNDLVVEKNSAVSDNSCIKESSEIANTDFKKCKRKVPKASYKSRTFKKLHLRESCDCEATRLSTKATDNSLELRSLTTTSKTATCHKVANSNISSARLSKTSIADKILKYNRKTSLKARLNNKITVKAKPLDLTLLNNKSYSMQLGIVDGFAQKRIFLEDKDKDEFYSAKQYSLISEDSCLKSISNDYKSREKNELSCDINLKKSKWSKSLLCLDSNFQQSLQSSQKVSTLSTGANLKKEENSDFPVNSFCNVLPQKATPYLDCFPRHKLKFARGRKLLGNFEESILKGCLIPVNSVKGFRTEIGASGGFCPNHITLPADVSFYDLDDSDSGTTPYMAHVDLGDIEYNVPKKGAVQVTLFNPSETVVKMFVLNYDLSDMPPLCHTFIRQKTYYMPVGSSEDCPSSPKWLRFIIHLRFASSKTGKLYLHKDLKIVVLNKSNDDAASEFNQEPRELRSFLHVPKNPAFSNF